MRTTAMVLGAFLGAQLALGAAPSAAQVAIEAVRIEPGGTLIDPAAGFWQKATPVTVTMLPQTITYPMKPDAAIKALQVRAVHNSEWFALLIEWEDPTQSERVVVDRFGDQVAVEIPARAAKDTLPSPMMGNQGARVSIMQWRAAFQADLDHGEPTVRDLYPNAQVDLYPDQVLKATDARSYMGAVGVDNPISHPRKSPVLDQMAEGWGSMTVKPEQHADGRGVWKDGHWHVVIAHPLVTDSENDPGLAPGKSSNVAFAVWDGGNDEVGGRKAWSSWTPLKLAE